jgi:hypothetical protein
MVRGYLVGFEKGVDGQRRGSLECVKASLLLSLSNALLCGTWFSSSRSSECQSGRWRGVILAVVADLNFVCHARGPEFLLEV